ncbi:MAG: transport system ATP-binding/permease protein [Thermoleophilaceae bacterium]|nr:transport system ATP-binding/permease protein [Thermoleophilaceae bacterium]
MTERPPNRPPDDVSIVRRGRLAIEVDGDDGALVETRAPATEEPTVILRTAALLLHGERIPISAHGLRIGSAEDADVALPSPAASAVEAVVEATPDGHVLVASGDGRTFLNGERMMHGERRPLARGDAIAIGETILYYLPAGSPNPRLAPISPVDMGRVRAHKDVFTIGRDPDSDLVLNHPTVSRRHAVIRLEGGAATIEDCGSASGVRVSGRRVQRSPLTAGDDVAIGPFRIVYDGSDLVERAPATGLAVAANGVQVQIGDQMILQPTDLHLRPGELVAVIGESGAGKSTLLNVLAGVSAPTAGRVLIGGEEISARVSETGYVPQFDIVHGALTVREALDFAARLRLPVDTTAEERHRRIDAVLDQLGLTERADLRVSHLSGGQRKRAAVGIELLHRPGALFLDEPTTGLDPGFERKLMELFKELATGGQTVALVTHATASLSLCDRVLVMGRGGVLVFDGTPAALLDAFEVDDFEQVYANLAERPARPAVRAAAESPAHGRRQLPPISGRTGPRPIEQPLGYQARVLAARYATLLLRDKRHLRGALIQVPILGLLTGLLFKSDVFHRPPVDGGAGKAAQLIFLMITIAIWLGSINGAREIVKERNVITRELAIGVRVPAYLASKLIVLLTMTAAQVVLFSLIVLTLRSPGESQKTSLLLVGVLVLSSWVAVLFGLLVSAYASSEDHATGIIPLLLVPQLLLGGAIVPLADMGGVMSAIANLVPARWGFAAAGSIMHLKSRIDEDPQFSQVSHYGRHFFALSTEAFILVSAIFAAALFYALRNLLSKSAIASADRPRRTWASLLNEVVNPRGAQ